MNENSETWTQFAHPTYFIRIGVQARSAGQCYGTGIRDEYMNETMMQIREPFKVAGHGPGSH